MALRSSILMDTPSSILFVHCFGYLVLANFMTWSFFYFWSSARLLVGCLLVGQLGSLKPCRSKLHDCKIIRIEVLTKLYVAFYIGDVFQCVLFIRQVWLYLNLVWRLLTRGAM